MELTRQLRESPHVFVDCGRFTEILAQAELGKDKIDEQLAVGKEGRSSRHERLGENPVALPPAIALLAAQLEELHVKPSDIKLMAVSHSHPDHAGNVEMFPNTLMLVQRVEYEWAGSRQDTVAFNKKHPVKLVDGDYDIFGDGSLVLPPTPGHTPATNLCS